MYGFGGRAPNETGSTKGGNVSGAFERSLDGGGGSGSTGASYVAAFFDLAFDVGAEELRERRKRAAEKAAANSAYGAKRGAKLCTEGSGAEGSRGGRKGACNGFCGSTGCPAYTFYIGEGLTEFAREGSFGLKLLLNAAFATKAF